jgi:hypothetical protein
LSQRTNHGESSVVRVWDDRTDSVLIFISTASRSEKSSCTFVHDVASSLNLFDITCVFIHSSASTEVLYKQWDEKDPLDYTETPLARFRLVIFV